ncbi:hypothetical protein GCM10023329_51260 [Streptomyces sanyensis]|uniref:Uncharacterized protein n=1 Tax=Streptomyces sanyensis TaxID=568869 RepID=A0ABP9BAD4_9ACTN
MADGAQRQPRTCGDLADLHPLPAVHAPAPRVRRLCRTAVRDPTGPYPNVRVELPSAGAALVAVCPAPSESGPTPPPVTPPKPRRRAVRESMTPGAGACPP